VTRSPLLAAISGGLAGTTGIVLQLPDRPRLLSSHERHGQSEPHDAQAAGRRELAAGNSASIFRICQMATRLPISSNVFQERAGPMRCRDVSVALLRFCRFASNAEAVAATEFAIILPFMPTLYLGSIEAGDGMAVPFKTTLVMREVADITSPYTSINNSTMTGILGAAPAAVVAPYPASGMVVTISEITTNSTGQGKIAWSDSLNGTAHDRLVGDAPDRAANRQCILDLGRGDVPPADVRLCAHRQGQYPSEQLFLSAIVDVGDAGSIPDGRVRADVAAVQSVESHLSN